MWALSSYLSQLLGDHMSQTAMPNLFGSQGTIRVSVLGRRLATKIVLEQFAQHKPSVVCHGRTLQL